MKKLAICVVAGAVSAMSGLMMTGCDWSSGGGADSWNSAYNGVNFNGTYRGANGGVLITDYSATPGTGGTTNTMTDELVATGNGSSTTFFKALNHDKVFPGSLTVVLPGYTFNDNGAGGLNGTGGASGTIDYGTGYLTLDFNGAAPDIGIPMRASYQYTISGTTGSGSAASGTTGRPIFAFTIWHDGENLAITDNNGAKYEGRLGQPRGTVSASDSNGVAVVSGPVIAQFSATGVSAAGYNVEMTGTFQGTASATVLADRRMLGIWIEKGGRTGDVNGEAMPVTVAAGSGGTAF